MGYEQLDPKKKKTETVTEEHFIDVERGLEFVELPGISVDTLKVFIQCSQRNQHKHNTTQHNIRSQTPHKQTKQRQKYNDFLFEFTPVVSNEVYFWLALLETTHSSFPFVDDNTALIAASSPCIFSLDLQ